MKIEWDKIVQETVYLEEFIRVSQSIVNGWIKNDYFLAEESYLIEGCNDNEIDLLKLELLVELPKSYIEVLKFLGKKNSYGLCELTINAGSHRENIEQIKSGNRKMLDFVIDEEREDLFEDGSSPIVWNESIFFASDSAGIYFYFICNEEDPIVHAYLEGVKVINTNRRLSQFLYDYTIYHKMAEELPEIRELLVEYQTRESKAKRF